MSNAEFYVATIKNPDGRVGCYGHGRTPGEVRQAFRAQILGAPPSWAGTMARRVEYCRLSEENASEYLEMQDAPAIGWE